MSRTYENLLWEEKDGLVVVTVNRPKALNALNAGTLDELNDAMLAIHDRSDLGAVILTGAGERAFVAGADIGELAEAGASEGRDASLKGQAVFRLFEQLHRPVIAAVNGFALGGGCELALACNMRIAAEEAKFGLPEVKLGLIPGYGGTQRLPRLVGIGRALELILSGEAIDAAEAYRIGLVNRVVPQAKLMEEAEKTARVILQRGPLAVRFALEAVYRGFDMSLGDGQQLEASLFGQACGSEDKQEGTKAFMEKRPARFVGR
jgi:enoyl-CoA hydratase